MPKDMSGVMKEFSEGDLHSGSKRGPVVKNRKQAIAIGLSEQRAMGKHVPKPRHGDGLHKAMSHVGSGGY